jgi:hypothetical protein
VKPEDVEALAVYNAEMARGRVHDPDVQAAMVELQLQFNREMPPYGHDAPLLSGASMKARCQICTAEGVGSVVHRSGCGGSTSEMPLIALGCERLGFEDD